MNKNTNKLDFNRINTVVDNTIGSTQSTYITNNREDLYQEAYLLALEGKYPTPGALDEAIKRHIWKILRQAHREQGRRVINDIEALPARESDDIDGGRGDIIESARQLVRDGYRADEIWTQLGLTRGQYQYRLAAAKTARVRGSREGYD